MKIILIIFIITLSMNGGIFGDTPEEKAIAKERLKHLFTGLRDDETMSLINENNKLKKLLTKRKINYKYPLKTMRRKNGITKIKSFIITKEKEEKRRLHLDNKELKRLIAVNGIITKEKIIIKEKNNKDIERIKAKENLKLQMKQAILDVN